MNDKTKWKLNTEIRLTIIPVLKKYNISGSVIGVYDIYSAIAKEIEKVP